MARHGVPPEGGHPFHVWQQPQNPCATEETIIPIIPARPESATTADAHMRMPTLTAAYADYRSPAADGAMIMAGSPFNVRPDQHTADTGAGHPARVTPSQTGPAAVIGGPGVRGRLQAGQGRQ